MVGEVLIPSNLVGKVFRFMDTGQVLVLLNGQVLTEGSVIDGNIVDGDYVFVNAVNSPIENGKALVLAEQPQTGDVVRVIGFFSVYEY
jgi:predicted ribosome-associated RNA-binding protein Tma20